MDDSGILSLESAEATFEREVIPEEEEVPAASDEEMSDEDLLKSMKNKKYDAPDIDMSTLDKLKEKFGSFFNGDAKDGDAERILEELGKAQKKKAPEEPAEEEQAEDSADTEEVPNGDDLPTESDEPKVDEPATDEGEPEAEAAEEPAAETDETAEEKPAEDASEEKPADDAADAKSDEKEETKEEVVEVHTPNGLYMLNL